MNIDVKIVHEISPTPGPIPEGKERFYVTFEFEKASLQKIAPENREAEISDGVWSILAAIKKAVVAHMLEQTKP